MKCEHCGVNLLKDDTGYYHKGSNWFTGDDEVCYQNRIEYLREQLAEAKERINELESIVE